MLLLLSVILLSGCQSTPTAKITTPDNVYLDSAFPSDRIIESKQEIFEISPEMRQYVNSRLKPLNNVQHITSRLVKDLFSPNVLNFNYYHGANYTAAETFDKGIANCMSLTLLSYLLVKEAGVDASMMDVVMEENWSINNGQTMLNGHVNLKVYKKEDPANAVMFAKIYTVDFVPMLDVPVISERALTEDEFTALYYNNKGATALAHKDYALAYQYFKTATLLNPYNAALWGNLASLYRQSGHIETAETLLLHATRLDPSNLNVKENLALLYSLTDRPVLAKKLRKQVADKRKDNPYYHAMLGEEAAYKGQTELAIKHLKKAIKMNNQEHRFYFALARSYMDLGELEKVEQSLKRAQKLAKENDLKQKYQNKISALSNLHAKL